MAKISDIAEHKLRSLKPENLAYVFNQIHFQHCFTCFKQRGIYQSLCVNKTSISIATDNLNGRTIENTFSMFLDNHGNILGKMSWGSNPHSF